MNAGKTSFILGLIHTLRERGMRVGYIKPIAQRFVEIDGGRVSEDAFLIKRVFHLPLPFEVISPCVIEPGFTRKYLQGRARSLMPRILKAYRRIEEASDLTIIEGTGHAGVGSVVDLSNADMARLLKAPVLLVAEGGIGNTIDRVMLNKTFFETKGCQVVGVLVNKVRPENYVTITHLLRKGLSDRRIQIFGYIPYEHLLSCLTLSLIKEELKGDVINNRGRFDTKIDDNVVATMEPDELIDIVSKTERNVLIITSADRTDILLACITLYYNNAKNLTGILLSGRTIAPPIRELIRKIDLPVIASDESIYNISSRLHSLAVKLSPYDKEKIDIIFRLVPQQVMVDRLLDSITPYRRKPSWIDKLSQIFRRLLRSIKESFFRIESRAGVD